MLRSRNAYANYYQYLGQIEFLRALKAEQSQQHVVFMDMDVLVLDSILELFCSDFGYGLTINANEFDPIDIGLQFVQASHYDEAIAFLQASLLPPVVSAISGIRSSQVSHENAFAPHPAVQLQQGKEC